MMRYHLRTLIAAVLIVNFMFGLFSKGYRDSVRRDRIRATLVHEGFYIQDDELDSSVFQVIGKGPKIDDNLVEQLRALGTVTTLKLRVESPHISDASIRSISRFSGLKVLDIDSTIDRDDLALSQRMTKQLADASMLQELHLGHLPVGGDALNALSTMAHLRILDVTTDDKVDLKCQSGWNCLTDISLVAPGIQCELNGLKHLLSVKIDSRDDSDVKATFIGDPMLRNDRIITSLFLAA